jgi:RNA recognition motif-containing protein
MKGKGKGASKSPKMDKLGKMDAAVKVWVGGLAETTTWKKLEKHFEDVVKAKLTEIMGKGRACVAFASEDDAQTCIGAFNGTELDGNVIEVDVWTQKEKTERPERPARAPAIGALKGGAAKGGFANKGAFAKGGFAKGDSKGAGKGKSKSLGTPGMKEKFKKIDDAMKVWVGGLNHKTKLKDLKQHFTDHGCEPQLADLMKPGTACLAFETEDEVETAIGACNGSELDEKTLEVDVWTKPAKKD